MSRGPRIGAAAVALLLTGLLGAATAHAAPYEPNDSVLQASGPLSGGTDYDGAIETDNDTDYFYFNTVGQRQIDISLIELSGMCAELGLYGSQGEYVDSTDDAAGGTTFRILHTAPSATQYVIRVDGNTGCAYRLRIEPADAVTTASPGLVATLRSNDAGSDDAQRVFVDGRLIGETRGENSGTFTLGRLPASSRITFEAENFDGGYAWDATITNQNGRVLSTIFQESESESSDPARVGIVRRVVMTPSGSPLESCGETFASITCIPIDRDGDGTPSDRDCNEADARIHPGAPEILDNAVDENCDGIAARRVRVASKVSLKRRGARYSGRLRSTNAACLSGRRVVLRRKGAGTRRFGTAYTSRAGRYRIRRSRRVRGRVYVVAAAMKTSTTLCTAARSKRVRG